MLSIKGPFTGVIGLVVEVLELLQIMKLLLLDVLCVDKGTTVSTKMYNRGTPKPSLLLREHATRQW